MSFDNENKSYNRYNNDGEQRPRRPRVGSYNREGGERPYRSANGNRNNYGERPQRPRFNPNAEGGYSSERAYRPRVSNYNREGGYNSERPQRPRFNPNVEGGEHRSFRPRFNPNREGGYSSERPQRPRFNPNAEGGYSQDRPQRPRFQGAAPQPKKKRQRSADYNPNAKYSMKKQIEYKDILTDPNEPIRLNKYLANAGICSRREADEFITAGVVSVNGVVVTELGTKIKRTDEVKFHDEAVSVERKVYVLLNKPKDCVTTSDDPQERKTVMHCVKDACKERIYPVGRLDRNTTGVLLLTNDGDIVNKILRAGNHHEKEYLVTVNKPLTPEFLKGMAGGVPILDTVTKPCKVWKEYDKSFHIIITQGLNRQIRRMCKTLGYQVSALKRIRIMNIMLDKLQQDKWREISGPELETLYRMAGV